MRSCDIMREQKQQRVKIKNILKHKNTQIRGNNSPKVQSFLELKIKQEVEQFKESKGIKIQ